LKFAEDTIICADYRKKYLFNFSQKFIGSLRGINGNSRLAAIRAQIRLVVSSEFPVARAASKFRFHTLTNFYLKQM